MRLKKYAKSVLLGGIATMFFTMTVLAGTSESLNNGGATWSGGESSKGILFSKLVDNKKDKVQYKVTVWVKTDKGNKQEVTGTTTAVGDEGRVIVTCGSTHDNPFKPERVGYNNFEAVHVK